MVTRIGALRCGLLAGSIIGTLALAAQPAEAQDAAASTPSPQANVAPGSPPSDASNEASASGGAGASRNGEIVVTGSILRNPNLVGPSPVTRLSSQDLQARGVTTIANAMQTLTANNSGNLPASFSANGAFANGAAGVSLRGLTVDSTLVLIDGLRAAYYPLADDGERNFVDINSIPQSIVQTIDVEQDGASATYGADAVAGVVNIITRKEIKGIEGGVEGGISQRKDAGHERGYLTYGHGDLASDGYNFYVNGEYQNDDLYYNRDRGYPYNTGDLRGIGGTNGNASGIQDDGTIAGVGATAVAVVRPVTVAPDGTITNVGGYRPISSALGCGSQATHVVSQGTVCEQNLIGDYRVISPHDTRLSGTARLTVNVGDNAQAYAMFTYSQNRVFFTGTPSSIRQTSASGDVDFSNILLPVTLSNGQLNPNNPFAAAGEQARIYYRFADLNPSTLDLNRTYRGAAGITGSFGSDWKYDAAFVGMTDDLTRTTRGVPTYQGILDAIADGSYNFVNPALNSDAVRNAIAPKSVQAANSQEYAGNATISKGVMTLPGGTLEVGVGGQVRYESLSDPSANPDNPDNPTAQYLPQINGFGAFGHRWVESGYFEIGAPIVKQLTVNVSGRYDHYSEGFSHFSPKVGVLVKPVDQLTLRGTFSKGFRVPSFAETGALPTIGYISYTPTDPAFLAQHQNSTGTGPDAYAQTYSLGLNSVGNPNLKPEIATNFTGGAIIKPLPWLTITGDYYYIKKTHFITLADYSGPVEAYFTGGDYPAGITVTPDVADPDHPDATPRPGIVNLGYINAAKLVTSGFDVQLNANIAITDKLKWTSGGEATYIFKYDVTYPGIGKESYAGTLGPANITSASGTPRWRANWQNTFAYNKFALTVVAYYTSGYKLTAEDVTGPGTRNDCSQAQQGFAGDPQRCHVKSFIDVDATLNYDVSDKFAIYTNIYNIADRKAPLDTGTYGGYQYNPAWAYAGILGRAFRIGARFKI